MQKYIDYLLQDLYNAKMNIGEVVNAYDETCNHPSSLPASFIEVPCKSMSEWFGIEHYEFPPFYKLTKKQAQQLTDAIIDLWNVFNINAIFAEEMTCRDKYAQLVRFWQYKVQYIPNGKWTVDWSSWSKRETAM
ncbi:MAG: hypothetical protein R3E32_00930 [Chitinophagales bacterium]